MLDIPGVLPDVPVAAGIGRIDRVVPDVAVTIEALAAIGILDIGIR